MAKENGHLANWKQAIPNPGVVVWYGHRRKGKTAAAWSLAEKGHDSQPVASFMFPRRARHLLPSWVKHTTTIQEVKKLRGYLVVADEMAIHAHCRDHQSEPNKEITKLLAVAAQAHQLLFLICQHSRQLDVGLVMEPDVIVFKQPSMLHIRFARPELRPEIQQAWDVFQGVTGDPRAWAYVVNFHDGRTGFLKNRLPSFWTEELSEAYALYEMESLIAQSKSKGGNRNAKS